MAAQYLGGQMTQVYFSQPFALSEGKSQEIFTFPDTQNAEYKVLLSGQNGVTPLCPAWQGKP